MTPTTTANATLTTATRIDACVATSTRESTSRPSSSVPNQCSPLGERNALGTSTSFTPKGAIQLAATATKMTTPNTIVLMTVTGLRSNSRHDGDTGGFGGDGHASRILGSTTAYSTSTMRLMSRNRVAINSTAPWITG